MLQNNLILILIMLLGFDCTGKKDTEGSFGSTSKGVYNVAKVISVTKRENMAPNFSWKDKDGKIVDFDSFRGEVTLVNFWATWCGPCKRELPDLISLSKEMSNRNVRILGISTDKGANVMEELSYFVAKVGISYQIVLADDDLEEAFGNVRVIPTTFLIDKSGKIVKTIVGTRSKEQFAEEILALLK